MISANMLEQLSEERYHDFALIGFAFAIRMFHNLKQLSDLDWLERKYHTMYDIIHNTPFDEKVNLPPVHLLRGFGKKNKRGNTRNLGMRQINLTVLLCLCKANIVKQNRLLFDACLRKCCLSR
jgi:hypothetical protein